MKKRVENTDPIFIRIDTLMSRHGKKDKEIIDYLGLAKGTYTNWKTSFSRTYLSHIGEICTYLQTTPNYLIFGDIEEDHPYVKPMVSAEESYLLSIFRQLKSVRQNDLISIAKMMTVD